MRARRRRARNRLAALLAVLAAVIIGALLWLAWQPYFRVSKVTIYGGDASAYTGFATGALAGSWLGIFPRNSILLVPGGEIRRAILLAHPEIAAVSVFRSSFTALAITIHSRVAIARWCGLAYAPVASSTQPADCYLFDGNGYVYALASSSDQTLNSFVVYDALTASAHAPIGNTLFHADELPGAFSFARALEPLGSPAESVALRDDEVDDLLASGTRITYLLGQEQQAFAALGASKANLDLSSGAVDYVDLRFPGDVYVKKKDGSTE